MESGKRPSLSGTKTRAPGRRWRKRKSSVGRREQSRSIAEAFDFEQPTYGQKGGRGWKKISREEVLL